MEYFVLTTRGLEKVVLKDLKENLKDIAVISHAYRRIFFHYNGHPSKLIKLRSADDVLICVKSFKIGHYRKELKILSSQIKTINLLEKLKSVQKVRTLQKRIIFSITVSNIGKKNYGPIDIKNTISNHLIKKYNWRYEENGPHDINFRIFIEHDLVIYGIRLNDIPLHRRGYKTQTLPASLKASVAYCLLKMADLKKSEILVDPFCGVGTIAIEAALFGATAIAGDIDIQSLKIAQINSINAGVKIKFNEWDARKMKLTNESIDKIVTNLPFDRQIKIKEDNYDFFSELFREFSRILKNKGKIVCLTTHDEIIKEIISKSDTLKIIDSTEISLFGQKPHIIEILKIP